LVLPSSLPKSPAKTSPFGPNANEVGVDRPDANAVTVPPAGAVGRGGPAATADAAPHVQTPTATTAVRLRTLIIPYSCGLVRVKTDRGTLLGDL
jgi:hypothetical protein